MSKIVLKVAHKSVAETIRMVKKEERKQLGYGRYLKRTKVNDYTPFYKEFNLLREGRLILRREARCMGIARGYLKGRIYEQIEQPVHNMLTEGDRLRITLLIMDTDKNVEVEDVYNWLGYPVPSLFDSPSLAEILGEAIGLTEDDNEDTASTPTIH